MKMKVFSLMLAAVMLMSAIVPAVSAASVNDAVQTGGITELLTGSDLFQKVFSTVTSLIDKIKMGLGDADGDGILSILDATAIQRWLADLPVSKWVKRLADFDGDGEVTILDATAIQRYLAGLLCPHHQDDPTEPPTEAPTQPPTEAPTQEPTEDVGNDIGKMTKLSQIFELGGKEGAMYDDARYVYILTYNDCIYRVNAALTPEIVQQISDLDIFDDDYDEKFDAIVGNATISSVEDLTYQIVPQPMLDLFVGMTGQQLIDMGLVPTGSYGYNGEHMDCDFGYGAFSYNVVFAEKIDSYDDIDGNETFKTLTVASISYVGIYDGTFGL